MSEWKKDEQATIGELKELVNDFMEARNWSSVHEGKSLAMSIAIEAAELMEHFQWGDGADYHPDKIAAEEKHEIAMEVADVMIYMLRFCRTLGIDLAESVQAKMEKNEARFPVDKVRIP